ncbi:MAG: hypothetical protein NTW87_15675 [Planctomycetota bacterium]|nr:hypothetical protein [Planctomycetota bacterium]
MGRITCSVTVASVANPSKSIQCDALVDTGAAHLVLPAAWRGRLGSLETLERVTVETATQETVQGEICGPVKIGVEGFRGVYGEVLFLDMRPQDGQYQPLIGYLVLEAIPAAVDMLGHRLLRVPHVDLK